MPRLVELALAFLRLGVTAFGGPAAHIALMEEEFVRRRQWISRERFLDVLGASSLIPGPTSTELAMHIGLARSGWPGLLVAGVAFIAPAAVLVGLLAALYVRLGGLPAFDGVLRAIKPVVVVVVVVALARTALRSLPAALLAAGAALLAWIGAQEVQVLLLTGVVNFVIGRRRAASSAVMALGAAVTLNAAGGAVPAASLFAYFVRAGSVIFGSGYVLFAVLRGDLVERYRWLTEGQLIDAIAVGQVTPGPVFTAATFIGYLHGGATGAVLATIGIFLPAFVFTALSARLLSRLRGSAAARAFLDGASSAAVALIGLVVVSLGRAAIVDATTAAYALAALLLIVGLRLNSAWVILGSALAGALLRF